LLSEGYAKLYDKKHVEYLMLPVELPIVQANRLGGVHNKQQNNDIDDDPDFETLNYSITDPIVLQVFEDAAGLSGLPSPQKIRKSSYTMTNDDEELDIMSISGEEIEEIDDEEEFDRDVIINNIVDDVFLRLSTLGIFYQRQESEKMVRDSVDHYIECGYPEDKILENVVAQFI